MDQISLAEPLRLTWRRTWPDRPDDFVAEAPEARGGIVGRLYRMDSTTMGTVHWKWFLNGYLPEARVHLSRIGADDDKGIAARQLEAAWFEALGRFGKSAG